METKLTRSKSDLEQVLQAMTTEEKNRNYKEADKLQKQAQGLKKQIEELEKKFNLRKQKREKSEMSEILDEEKKNFEQAWEQKLLEAKTQGEKLLNEQALRHEQECTKMKSDFEAQEQQYHDSGAVIVLKRKQQSLGKQGCYMDAHEVQQQRFRLQAQQKEAFMRLRAEKLKIKLKQLKLKQDAEREVLKKKTEAKLQQMKKQKIQEQQVMNLKHSNIQRQFASEQEKQNLIRTGMIKNSIYASTALSPTWKIKSRANFLSSQKIPSMNTK